MDVVVGDNLLNDFNADRLNDAMGSVKFDDVSMDTLDAIHRREQIVNDHRDGFIDG